MTTTSDLPFQFFLDTNPVPASRPRVTRQGWAYYPKAYKEYLERLTTIIKEHANNGVRYDTDRPLHVTITCWVRRPKNPTNPYPIGDVDNFAKGVLDAMQRAGLIVDDKSVTSLSVTKSYSNPLTGYVGIHVEIEEDNG